ncbi:hypothetical protein BT96DRAFT_817036 [Gymnopus androsaceus JB14]|uniref:Uncharacterized protein n=1 Tax=Gymnopus androsaceus JB14 TaxID=1447944 RepID=A0A6A4HXZ8_9AGAR|nr:hypothetical protein BT96DRAFT_817036 [Gymnopus androsaceus JB14]
MASNSVNDLEKASIEEIEVSKRSDQRSPIQLTSEQYERLLRYPAYIPLAKNLGNPTPLGMITFILVQAPTAFIQMGWGNTTVAANTALFGTYYMVGGLGLIIAGVMEWLVGNTFPCVAFITFGGNWLSIGALLDPAHEIASTFPGGTSSPDYNKALIFYFAFWTFLTIVYFLTSLRINVALAWYLLGNIFQYQLANGLNAAAYGELGNGNIPLANALAKAGGAFEFVVVCVATYQFVALMFESVDMPFKLPLGDLSNVLTKKTKLS